MKLSVLKDKNFRLLMCGKLVSLIGTQMQSMALSLYVLKKTGSAAVFASVLAVTMIPRLVLGPICGVIVDWADRKKIIVYLDFFSGIITAIYAFIFFINGELSITNIYILVISLSLISTLFQPAIGTIIPSIVEKDYLLKANSINTLILNLGKVIAPAIGGILYGLYGLYIVLILNSISFVGSAISETFIKIPKKENKDKKINLKVFKNDFIEGLSFIKNNKLILNIIIIGLVINCVGDPIFSIVIPFISKKIIFISDTQYGFLESAFVASMLISPLICNFISNKIQLEKLLFLDILFVSIFIGIMAVIPTKFYMNMFNSNMGPYVSLIIILCLIGVITSTANIVLNTLFQKEIPLNMLGRVGTTMTTISMGGIPLGQMVFGIMLTKITVWKIIIATALILFVTIQKCKKGLYSHNEKLSVEVSQ